MCLTHCMRRAVLTGARMRMITLSSLLRETSPLYFPASKTSSSGTTDTIPCRPNVNPSCEPNESTNEAFRLGGRGARSWKRPLIRPFHRFLRLPGTAVDGGPILSHGVTLGPRPQSVGERAREKQYNARLFTESRRAISDSYPRSGAQHCLRGRRASS